MNMFSPVPKTQSDGFKDLTTGNMFVPVPFIPEINQTSKIENFDLTLTFINAKVANGKYTFLYMNNIISKDFSIGSMGIRASQINFRELQSKIMSNVNKSDLKYIKLKEFNTSKSIFVFDIDSWLDDALKNVKGVVFLSRFDKEYRLKIQPPKMVMYYGIRPDFSKYVASYFKEYIKKKPNQRNVLFDMVPKNYENVIKTNTANMFDYEYEFQNNRMIVRLKSVYITGLIFSAFSLISKENQKKSFDEMVKKNLSTFGKDKLNKIAFRKFF